MWIASTAIALPAFMSDRFEMPECTTVFAADDKPVATMLLNLASMKDSYANYEREHKALYG